MRQQEGRGEGTQEMEKKNKVYFLLKICDGILVGDRTPVYLDRGGIYMTMYFSKIHRNIHCAWWIVFSVNDSSIGKKNLLKKSVW